MATVAAGWGSAAVCGGARKRILVPPSQTGTHASTPAAWDHEGIEHWKIEPLHEEDVKVRERSWGDVLQRSCAGRGACGGCGLHNCPCGPPGDQPGCGCAASRQNPARTELAGCAGRPLGSGTCLCFVWRLSTPLTVSLPHPPESAQGNTLVDETVFQTLFPKYRESYLRQWWPHVTSTLKKHVS